MSIPTLRADFTAQELRDLRAECCECMQNEIERADFFLLDVADSRVADDYRAILTQEELAKCFSQALGVARA